LLSSDLADSRRQGDTDRLKDLTAVSAACGANGKALALFFHGDGLQSLEILFDVRPLKHVAGVVQAPFQFLAQDQSQEAAEHVAPDVLITLVEYRPGFWLRPDIPEDPFHLQQFLVLEGHLFGGKIRVGGQDLFAVKASLFFDLIRVDAGTVFGYLQVTPKALVADQAFGPFF